MRNKLQPYKKLKSTEAIWLPQVPEHWELVKVRHLFKESTKKGFPNETLLVASQEHGVVSKDAYGKRTVEATKDLHNLKLVEQGDFVISLRSFQGGIEVAHERGIISPAYTVMKETKPIEKRYFKNLFKSPPFISLMTLCVKGIREGQNIDYPTFKNEYLPLPPIEEQQAIAAYLDKKNNEIDKFIRNKERLVELLEGQKKRLIYDYVTKGIKKHRAFTDFEVGIFGRIPSDWIVSKLKYVCYNLNNRRIPLESVERGRMTNRLYDYYGATGVIDQVEHYIFDETTILVAEDGANLVSRNLQLVYIATGKYWVNNHSHIIKPRNNMNLFYLSYLLDLTDYNPFITGSTQPKLTKDAFMSIIVVRPSIEEQNEIIKRIDIEIAPINLAISKAHQEISSIKEYREALITDLVTGRRSVPQ